MSINCHYTQGSGRVNLQFGTVFDTSLTLQGLSSMLDSQLDSLTGVCAPGCDWQELWLNASGRLKEAENSACPPAAVDHGDGEHPTLRLLPATPHRLPGGVFCWLLPEIDGLNTTLMIPNCRRLR